MNLVRELPPQYLQNCPTIDGKYKVLFKLGTGRFSKVRMAICLATNARVAIKIMNQRDSQDSKVKQYDAKTLKLFLNQIKMCAKSKHRNIIKIIDFEVGGVYRLPDGSARHIMYYVMKIASNGQLHRILKQSQIFTQKLARYLFRQLIQAVQFLHGSRVAHRDIKSQNILIDQRMNLRLADFGCSSYFIDYQHNKIQLDSSQPIGSVKNNAPQLTNQSSKGVYHGDEVDLFACGYVLFQMVMKAQPFKSSNTKDKHYSILAQGNFDGFWKIFSGQCTPTNQFKDLIQRLFDPNPKTRIDMTGVKKHSWYLGQIPTKNEYKKQIRLKLKKIQNKVRKQQEQQIKSLFKQQRSKIEFISLGEIVINRQFEEQILNIREMLRNLDSSDSSSSVSNADAKQIKQIQEKQKQKTTIKSQE